MRKKILLQLLLIVSLSSFSQSCFSSDGDVINYILYKTFESKDGNMSVTFGPSSASVQAGYNSFTYIYEKYYYIRNSGYKGVVKMTNTSTGNQMTLYISCRERMVTDGQGALLYESGT